ncbi:MAG: squalene--hopene cyclase [Rubripirellula sp.]
MRDSAQLWADPRLVYTVAATAVALLLITIWLFQRQRKQGRQAGFICLFLSVALHIALIFLVPFLPARNGGSSTVREETTEEAGIDSVAFSTFDPDMEIDDASNDDQLSQVAPLPVSNLTDLLDEPQPPAQEPETLNEVADVETEEPLPSDPVPESLANEPTESESQPIDELDTQLGELLDQAFAAAELSPPPAADSAADMQPAPAETSQTVSDSQASVEATPVSTATAPARTVVGDLEGDFANRVGAAKVEALQRTGGNEDTEAAVEAALKYLAESQRTDGAWDPRTTGAGTERAPLGMNRGGAGSKAESAITGLALLTLMGAGQTHQQGDYADNVFRGLAYLINHQKPSGSLAGDAAVYAANYSHGMAALSMCEAAAITRDASALQSASRALAHTQRMQHPSTGGWRYTQGDPGDLSQLGWQAMVLDAGHRAEIQLNNRSVTGVQRFLRSVRMGSSGGLASYRPGEAPSRTMTAEALATRLLIGEKVPANEIAEAERYLLQQPPGVGQDNYYYWYYATLALHQLQDDAWDQWNEALKRRLLATQRSDGSWPADTLWGGYGGSVYTTSMATLCLETYYRHAIRSDDDRIANRPTSPMFQRR